MTFELHQPPNPARGSNPASAGAFSSVPALHVARDLVQPQGQLSWRRRPPGTRTRGGLEALDLLAEGFVAWAVGSLQCSSF